MSGWRVRVSQLALELKHKQFSTRGMGCRGIVMKSILIASFMAILAAPAHAGGTFGLIPCPYHPKFHRQYNAFSSNCPDQRCATPLGMAGTCEVTEVQGLGVIRESQKPADKQSVQPKAMPQPAKPTSPAPKAN